MLFSTDMNAKKYVELDAGVKACIAIALVIITIVSEESSVFLVLLLYLIFATVLLKSNLRFILKNLAVFAIVILLPYTFGLCLSALFQLYSANALSAVQYIPMETVKRIVKIFYVWYVLNLYFFSTPLEILFSLLNKFLRPVQAIGVPVTKYLIIIKCVIIEITRSVQTFREKIIKEAGRLLKDKNSRFKEKPAVLARLLAGFITDSLQKTEEMQQLIDRTELENVYSFKIAKKEAFAMCSLILLLLCLHLLF